MLLTSYDIDRSKKDAVFERVHPTFHQLNVETSLFVQEVQEKINNLRQFTTIYYKVSDDKDNEE